MITWSLKFFADNFILMTALLLTASVGRAVQFNALGPISKTTNWLLEIPVEGSRIMLVLILIGGGSISKGFEAIIYLFQMTGVQWTNVGVTMLKGIKEYYINILVAILIVTVLAFSINYLISQLSMNNKVIDGIRQVSFLKTFNANAMTFFLKNLTVIPLILFFEVWLFLKILYKV
jgi:hypothetical protein